MARERLVGRAARVGAVSALKDRDASCHVQAAVRDNCDELQFYKHVV